MKTQILALGLLLAVAAIPASADPDDRTLSGAAIGAGAGAIVAGPVGAVAGGAAGAIIGGPRLVHHHKIYWRDRYGHQHWRWAD